MHGLVVSFYFYNSGSCVEYAAKFFAAELVNVVWFFHHCLPCFVTVTVSSSVITVTINNNSSSYYRIYVSIFTTIREFRNGITEDHTGVK